MISLKNQTFFCKNKQIKQKEFLKLVCQQNLYNAALFLFLLIN